MVAKKTRIGSSSLYEQSCLVAKLSQYEDGWGWGRDRHRHLLVCATDELVAEAVRADGGILTPTIHHATGEGIFGHLNRQGHSHLEGSAVRRSHLGQWKERYVTAEEEP